VNLYPANKKMTEKNDDNYNSNDNYCDMCKGNGKFLDKQCVYCNGTGEWNMAAQGYLKNHICQCIILDRKFCPVCEKPCHHDTTLNPKQKMDPGYGGMSPKNPSNPTLEPSIIT